MARQLHQIAAEYLKWYDANQAHNVKAAIALEQYLAELLADANRQPVLVSTRAKAVGSVRAKLLRKGYRQPGRDLTDRLGARVIMYHSDEVDVVAELLKGRIRVIKSQSIDKRLALGLREFGYRSYHLVGSLRSVDPAIPRHECLRGAVFEIQIRSLLEHAWAEIEHDVVYKSGATWPESAKRQFAALAAVLELLEQDFKQLAQLKSGLIEEAQKNVRVENVARTKLDVPYMCAILEVAYPDGLSFRRASAEGAPFPPGIEQLLLLALKQSGIATVQSFNRQLVSQRVRRAIRRYAQAEGIPSRELSHLAILSVIVAARAPKVFGVFFPEFAAHHVMRMAMRWN